MAIVTNTSCDPRCLIKLQNKNSHASNIMMYKHWNGIGSFHPKNVWTDGTNVYLSQSRVSQFVLNKENSTWEPKLWNGYKDIIGEYIWSDGVNIYYSNDTTHYVLHKDTGTWDIKIWEGISSFYGSNIWTDGINTYYSTNAVQYVLKKDTMVWEIKTWNWSPSFRYYIWTDGTNIYYSYDNTQRYLKDGRWEIKSWGGINPNGNHIWTNGEDIYYSWYERQYKLNKDTDTWDELDFFSNNTVCEGQWVWTDGINTYFNNREESVFSNQLGGTYVFDKELSCWQPKQWNGGSSATFDGTVWTDGVDIYLHWNHGYDYVLDKETSTWKEKTWISAPEYIECNNFWTDGTNIYYSDDYRGNYVINGDTWSPKTWLGLTSLQGRYVWTDGLNIYYSYRDQQFVLDKENDTWKVQTWVNLPSYFTGDDIWTDGENIYFSDYSDQFVLDEKTSTWDPKVWFGDLNFNGSDVWTDGVNIFCTQFGKSLVLNKETSTWEEWVHYYLEPGLNYITPYGVDTSGGLGGVWTDGTNIYGGSHIILTLSSDSSLYYKTEDSWVEMSALSAPESPKERVLPEDITTEEITVTPTKASQEILPENADYISKVTIDPIPDEYIIPEGEVEIFNNGSHDVSGKKTAIVSVPAIVEVDELPTENIDTAAIYKCGEKLYRYNDDIVGTWVLNDNLPDLEEYISYYVDDILIIDGSTYNRLYSNYTGYLVSERSGNVIRLYSTSSHTWRNEAYKIWNITSDPLNEDFKSWLKANATKQDAWVEYLVPKGSLTVTENSTVDVTKYAEVIVDVPASVKELQLAELDVKIPTNCTYELTTPEGYDGISKADITVEVTPTLATLTVKVTRNESIELVTPENCDGISKVNLTVATADPMDVDSEAILDDMLISEDYSTGNIFRYTGPNTEKYTTGALYILEEV